MKELAVKVYVGPTEVEVSTEACIAACVIVALLAGAAVFGVRLMRR